MLAFFLSIIEDPNLKIKFEDIYYAYKNDMLNIIFAILKNEHESEIALSDAFFAISKSLDSIAKKDERQIKSIIRKIAKNSAINVYNKNKNSKSISIDVLFDISDDTDFSNNIENSDFYNKLLSTLSKMSPSYRDVLYLRYVSNFSLKEICIMLGMNINTVKSHLKRGTKLLRDYLNEVGYND